MQRLADLREILHYVPEYRDQLFVIAIDGSIAEDPNFRNLLLDIALLGSLRIRVVLVHGAGHQVARLAAKQGLTPSNIDGTGVTDPATLELAVTAATRVSHRILEGLTVNDHYGAVSNAVVAHPAGILKGIDQQLTGRVERIETKLLRPLLANEIIPVIAPLGCDGEGQTFRLNSDAVAVEAAAALNAVKLIFITSQTGINITQPGKDEPQLVRQLTVEEADQLLMKQEELVAPAALSKLRHAVRAARKGVPRVHIIDGRVEEGLLAEVFSNQGIGTLIHTNEYQAVRPAQKKDSRDLYALISMAMENDELMSRSLDEIEAQIGDFYIFEIDQMPAGCVALHHYPDQSKAELACLCVHPRYENQRIGKRLLHFIEAKARAVGVEDLFCLSTQAYNYFVQKGGFHLSNPDLLPPERREVYERNGRRSLVLTKKLA